MTDYRTGFLSRCCRFGTGIGVLSVARGYGPIAPLEYPIVRAREGGPSARVIQTKRRKPQIMTVKLEDEEE